LDLTIGKPVALLDDKFALLARRNIIQILICGGYNGLNIG